MNTVFVGATNLGLLCCQRLIDDGESITGIVSAPRDFKISYAESRVRNVQHADFSQIAARYNIPYYEIRDDGMKDSKLIDFLQERDVEFILVVGWYHIVPKRIRDMANLGVAGLHASLLPKYRGGAPLVWALINGETETGVSLFYLGKGVDTGDILAQSKIPVDSDDDIRTLYEKVNGVSVDLIAQIVPKIASGRLEIKVQDESQATQWPQRSPSDGLIDWNQNMTQINNWVRAQTRPYPGAFTYFQGSQKTMVWVVRPLRDSQPGNHINQNGDIMINHGNHFVRCSDGYVELLDYEIDSRKNPEIKGKFGILEDK